MTPKFVGPMVPVGTSDIANTASSAATTMSEL